MPFYIVHGAAPQELVQDVWIGRSVRRNFCFIWGVCAEEFISRQHLLFICRACCLLVPREGVFLWRRVASETWRHQVFHIQGIKVVEGDSHYRSERTLVLATLIDVEITDVAIPRVVGICLASFWPKAFVFPASINELGECRVSRIA